ncbi:MAG: hypothetical protein HZB43_09170 [candidate division Zixibacteria bacterium]|nr:hypothetical protein [candidate division Zixibacteria bacterium]
MALGTGVRAQEHPEHPEHPSQAKTEAPAITMAALSQAIQDYVAKDSKLKGGYFLVFDSESKRVLQLKLAKVHEEKLASLGGGVYFACADFNSADTTLYDLDIFMKASGKRLETTEVAVHKVNGNPRYNWKEEGGIWKKQPVAGK